MQRLCSNPCALNRNNTKGVRRIRQYRDPCEACEQLFQKFDAFAFEVGRKRGKPCHVRARMGKAGHEADRNRVSADHDDWHRARRLLGSKARRSPPGDDGVHRQANQLGGKGEIAFGAALREAVLELQALLFDVAKATHPVAQPFERWPRLIGENADATNLRAPLGGGSERRRDNRAAEQRDELAAVHSITSSAATRRPGGTVRPSAFAVLRLTIVSTLVAACTGRSAGLSPRRMRST